MELNTPSNLTTLCRICMRDTVAALAEDIYEYEPTNADQLNLHGMLGAICAPVFASVDMHEQNSRESYGMPKTACPDCIDKVVAAYKLHETCIDTDRKLWEMIMLKQNLQIEEIVFVEPKIEPEDDIESLPAEIVVTVLDQDADSKKTREHTKTKETSQKQVTVPSTNKAGKPCYVPNDIKGGKCDLCPEVIRYKSLMKIHMKSVHKNHIYICEMCDDVFFTSGQYEQHTLFHKTGRRYGCLECEKRFATRSGIFNHTRTHAKDRLFKCSECDRSFTNKSNLKSHFRKHTGEKPFPCEQCPARFAQKKSWQLHMATHNQQKNFVCAICGSRFTREHSLVKHNRIHTGERPYECDQCDKKFLDSGKLKRHLRTHTGEKPYKCVYCDRAFAQSNDLVKHSRFHVGETPYKCDYCDSSFRLLSELRNHYKVHFQPGDEVEGSAQLLGSQYPTTGSETLKFTSAYMLNRRFKQEQEQKQEKKKTTKKSKQVLEDSNI